VGGGGGKVGGLRVGIRVDESLKKGGGGGGGGIDQIIIAQDRDMLRVVLIVVKALRT